MKRYGITLIAALGLVLAGCNKSVENASQKFNELPPAVQKTVRAQYPNGEVADVTKRTENCMELYDVQFREPGAHPKLGALPEKAQATIKAKAPEAEIADISRQEKDGRVIYEVAFRDKATMQVA